MSYVHPAYNPSFSACFFSWNSVFLSPNQPTMFFSRLINAAERSHVLQLLFKDQGLDELVLQDIKPQREVPETETPFWT
jgi:hypothetical protein